MQRTAIVFALPLLTACSSPLVGEWLSDSKLSNGEKNRLTVYSDNTGDARIFATSKVDLQSYTKFKFTFDWKPNGEEFDFDMKCSDGPCDNDDFDMDCKIIREGDNRADKMDCKGSARWKDYPFNWERSE